MTRIVTTHDRYKRPPRKRQAVALDVPAVVKAADPAKAGKRAKPAPAESTPAAEARESAIVTIRSRKGAMLAHLLEDLTPQELQRRGDAADALFREVVRRATGKERL
jgi:hypothetical protein